jgi:hypothetical protein
MTALSIASMIGLSLTLSSGQAVAKPSNDDGRACTAAYESAQERERSGHLIEAKESFLTCAKETCGTFLEQECTARYARLNADIPSVVPMVTDDAGAPRVDVAVTMDGEPLISRLDGRAVPVNPGMHEFVFSAGGKVFSRQKLLIGQGQRNRAISTSLRSAEKRAQERMVDAPAASPEADAPADRPRGGGVPALSYVLGGTGLAGIGAFALLTYWGRKDNDMLAQCSPNCPQSSVDHIHRLYVSADVSLGVGIAALGAAYWVFAASRSKSEEKPADEAYLFTVQPTSSGAFAAVSGSF